MCASLPFQVVAFEGDRAEVTARGQTLRVEYRLVPEIVRGDWVLVNAGQIISQITPEEADVIQDLLRAMVSLGETDAEFT